MTSYSPIYLIVSSCVSILVLVDLILWHLHNSQHLLQRQFQSLFWWILYCDKINLVNCEWYAPVSILVLVDLILWLGWLCRCLVVLDWFQSLFWWILYCDLGAKHLLQWLHFVSILVLVDLILWQIYQAVALAKEIRFNPCFGGSYIVTLWSLSKIKREGKVSILVLVDLILWQLAKKANTEVQKGFQSLFWWILYCDDRGEVFCYYAL